MAGRDEPTLLIDLAILVGYNAVVLALGCRFFRRSASAERFMAAGRSLPGWAVGLSIFGSYVSSISFLANPGKAYADNWNASVLAFSMPLATWIAVRWFVPFYRHSGEVSAYHHLERRFGPWARTYAVVCFLLVQFARLGTILYLLALALRPLVGLDVQTIIVLTGVVVTIYPLLGGTEAVIWTGAVQAVVLVGGATACLATLVMGMPDGPQQIFDIAAAEQKFSLGGFGASVSQSTFWVVLFYGLVTHLQNFGIDQAYVQRYITAKSDAAARRSIWLGTVLFIPVSLGFFFLGTTLFAFYQTQPELLPPGGAIKPDDVFPHFIAHQLPKGLTGLVLAAICAAAMDSNLNCSATLFLCDIYRRYLRPLAGERESLAVLRWSTLAMGALSTAVGLAMIRVRTALDVWWQFAGMFSGGMLGLFLLGMLSRRADCSGSSGRGQPAGPQDLQQAVTQAGDASVRPRPPLRVAGLCGVAAGIVVIVWMTWSPQWSGVLQPLRSPFHNLLTLVIGTAVVLAVGLLVSQWPRAEESEP